VQQPVAINAMWIREVFGTTTTVIAVSRSWRGMALVVVLGLSVAIGLTLVPTAHAAYPSTTFSVRNTGNYDAWGKVVWYNRSIRVMGTYRNWSKGYRTELETRTTPTGRPLPRHYSTGAPMVVKPHHGGLLAVVASFSARASAGAGAIAVRSRRTSGAGHRDGLS
jgi:hypothetical protein